MSGGEAAQPVERDGVGSVAQEAARLLELLSSGPARAEDGGGAEETAGCECGRRRPDPCERCPVCQVIGFVGRVRPETIERVADVVGLAATALRDLASVQRERRAAAGESEPR